jgi:hypothetical protein
MHVICALECVPESDKMRVGADVLQTLLGFYFWKSTVSIFQMKENKRYEKPPCIFVGRLVEDNLQPVVCPVPSRFDWPI